MITRDAIDRLPDGVKEGVIIALCTLYLSGILKLQTDLNKLPIVDGFNHGDPTDLTNRIIEAQQINRVLLGLHELGKTLSEESRHEPAAG